MTKTGSARPDATSSYANPESDANPAFEPGAVEPAPVVAGAAPEVVAGGRAEEGVSTVEVSAVDPSEVAPAEFAVSSSGVQASNRRRIRAAGRIAGETIAT